MLKKLLLVLFGILLVCCNQRSGKTQPLPGDACGNSAAGDTTAITDKLELPMDLLKNSNAMYSLEDGGESLVTRAWICDNAHKTIDFQYYIFSKDNTGLIACDFLVRAADRGVKVRLIVDDATMEAGSGQIYALNSHPNIEIKIYNPGLKVGNIGSRVKRIAKNIHRITRRMHNKTLTVDDQVTIIGGRNIADEYFDFDREYNFRDRDVLLFGRTVAQVKSSFEQYWNDKLCVSYNDLVNENKKKARDPHRFDKLHKYACDEKNFSPSMRQKIKNFPLEFKKIKDGGELVWSDNISFVADIPGKNEDRPDKKGGACLDSLLPILQSAKKTVDIQSPYLILTDEGKLLFTQLVKKGVRVRILTNSLGATDNYEAFSGYQRDRESILKTGIEVYEFKPHPAVRYTVMSPEIQAAINYTPVLGMHSKTMIVDGRTTVIGSFNLDPRSANLNSEVLSIIRSEAATKVVSKYVEEEFKPENCWRITPDFNPDKEASNAKRVKAATRQIFPKEVL